MIGIRKILESQLLRSISWQKITYLVLGIIILAWLFNTPAGLLGKADAVGYAVCHRIDARSFHIGIRQFSFCARCTGQYLGVVLGMVYQLVLGRRRSGRPSWGQIVVLGVLVLAYGLDGFHSYLHLLPGNLIHFYEPSNTLRVLTGTGLGIGLSVMVLPAFHQTMWKVQDRRPALGGWLQFGGLLLLGLLLDILVLSENPLILYPLALLSAAGVLIVLTLVYTMVFVMLFRLENRFERFADLTFPLASGFIIALLQIAAIDFLRYWWTGTWEGFHFG
ncbi:MAG: DUF2085 domain-containing protein [Chloroflexi bacterium]|jgi:uncharacterized membrane protein|nr:DUF2085 domain-containing protein [Chloroflexota bacterium]